MRGIGKPSIGKSLFGIAAAFLFVSAILILVPSEASAQFNIEGIIRGAVGHRHGGGYRSSGHSRGHESSRPNSSDKDKDASDQDSSDSKGSTDSKGSRGSASAHDTSQSKASDTPPAKGGPSTGPSKPSGDEPGFAPSR